MQHQVSASDVSGSAISRRVAGRQAAGTPCTCTVFALSTSAHATAAAAGCLFICCWCSGMCQVQLQAELAGRQPDTLAADTLDGAREFLHRDELFAVCMRYAATIRSDRVHLC